MAVQLRDNRILKYAAQLAYSVLLAFIPFIMLFNSLISWVYVDLDNWVVTKLLGILPDFLGPFVETAGTNLPGEGASAATLLIFGLLILYFSVYALRSFVITTTKVMGIHESRNYFVLWWVGFLYLVVIITLTVFFLILYFLAESIVKANAISFLSAPYPAHLASRLATAAPGFLHSDADAAVFLRPAPSDAPCRFTAGQPFRQPPLDRAVCLI